MDGRLGQGPRHEAPHHNTYRARPRARVASFVLRSASSLRRRSSCGVSIKKTHQNPFLQVGQQEGHRDKLLSSPPLTASRCFSYDARKESMGKYTRSSSRMCSKLAAVMLHPGGLRYTKTSLAG